MRYIILTIFIIILQITDISAKKPFPQQEIAYFAGGCFWCTEHDFEQLFGIKSVISGYMGGHIVNPSYQQVSSGNSGHYEVVQVIFRPNEISFQKVLSAFWRMHDPSDAGGSFCDRGQQYGTAIFYTNLGQKHLSKTGKKALNAKKKFNNPIATRILKASKFYPAEAGHQDYASRNPIRYKFYRNRCGRDRFIKKHWSHDNTLYILEK